MATQPLSAATQQLGQRIRTRRHQLGISQEQLAERAGLHWSFVSQIERGQRNLTLHNILKLASGLQVNPADLVADLPPPDD